MSANILNIVALLVIAGVCEKVRSYGIGRLCLLLGPCGPEVIPSSSKTSPLTHRKERISGRTDPFVYPCCRAYPPGQQIKFYCDPSYCPIPITLPLLPQPPATTDCCIDCPPPMSPGSECCSVLLCEVKFPVIIFPTTEPPTPSPPTIVAPDLENYDSEYVKECRPHCDNRCGYYLINQKTPGDIWDMCQRCFSCRTVRGKELDPHYITAFLCTGDCINDGHNGVCGVLKVDKDNLEGTWCEDCWKCRLEKERFVRPSKT